jgi:hypothetical protein
VLLDLKPLFGDVVYIPTVDGLFVALVSREPEHRHDTHTKPTVTRHSHPEPAVTSASHSRPVQFREPVSAVRVRKP